jgi:hypothetical protein
VPAAAYDASIFVVSKVEVSTLRKRNATSPGGFMKPSLRALADLASGFPLVFN